MVSQLLKMTDEQKLKLKLSPNYGTCSLCKVKQEKCPGNTSGLSFQDFHDKYVFYTDELKWNARYDCNKFSEK